MGLCDLKNGRSDLFLPQKQADYFRLRMALPAGDLKADTLEALSEIADKFGQGEIRITPRHEIEIPFIHKNVTQSAYSAVKALALQVIGTKQRPNLTACPGTDTCTTAISETRTLCLGINKFLDETEKHHGLPAGLRIAISGCPNECSHVSVNDIGFVGAAGAFGGKRYSGFEVHVGGSLPNNARTGERIAFVSREDLIPTLRDLLAIYDENREDKALAFTDFVLELGVEQLSRHMERKLNERIWFFRI